MNLNDFFSKPTRIKEAYANNYPSYPAADAADASSDSEPTFDRLTGEPKFDRLAKTGKEPELDFRNGLNTDDDETENEPELGTFRMGKPVEPDAADTDAFMSAVDSYGEQNPYMQSWGGKYADQDTRVAPLRPGEFNVGGTTWRRVYPADAAGTGAEVNRSSIAPYGWRYVEKGADPSTYTFIDPKDKAVAAPAAAASRSASAPPALDLTPKSKYKLDLARSQVPVDASGANPNIDDATRARARAWAAAKNSGVDTVGNIEKRVAAKPTATSADGTAALPTPAAAPAVVKPVVVVPPAAPVAVKPVVMVPPAAAATTLKDLPAEKPMSWKDIAQANGIDHPNLIMPGQVLKIPGRADYTVKPGDTLADIAAGKTKAPKYQPTTPTAGDTQPAAAAVLKKHPNIGTLAPIPRDVMKDLGMDAQTKKEIAKYGREELLTPAIIQQQKQADADIAAIDAKMRARAAAQAARKKTNEDDQTVPNEFKWGQPSWTARDGTVLAYDKKTNAYNMSSGPTKPDPNTMMSGIWNQRTTMKNGQPVNAFDRTFIAMNPATGTGHYTRSSQEGDNEPTQIHRRDVPADELAKLRADAGIPPKADDIDEGTFDDQTQVSSIDRDWTTDNNGQADHHFSSTSFQTDPNDPNNNSYMDRQDHNGVATQTYAKNVTPKWMSNLKSTAGLPGAAPAAQPPSQYPTQAGQGMNNRPFAAYSTPPGQTEITRESLDRMQSLAGIRKK